MRSPFETKRFRAANRRRHNLIDLYFLRGLTRQEQRKLGYLERVCDRVEAEYNRRFGITAFRENLYREFEDRMQAIESQLLSLAGNQESVK